MRWPPMDKLRTETLCIQAGYTPGNGEPRQIPIIQSTTFKYNTSEDMGKLIWNTLEHNAKSSVQVNWDLAKKIAV